MPLHGKHRCQTRLGHAKEFVEGMWRMMQQSEGDDYVLATGQTTTVRDFLRMAFEHAGIEIEFEGRGEKEIARNRSNGNIVMRVDPAYYRPTEVELLIGTPERPTKQWVGSRRYL